MSSATSPASGVLVIGAGSMGEGVAVALAEPAAPTSWSPTAPPIGRRARRAVDGVAGRIRPPRRSDRRCRRHRRRHRRRAAGAHRPSWSRRPWLEPSDRCTSSTSACPATSTRRSPSCRVSAWSTSTTCATGPTVGCPTGRRGRARPYDRRRGGRELPRRVHRPSGGTARRVDARAADRVRRRRTRAVRLPPRRPRCTPARVGRGAHQGDRREAPPRAVGAAQGAGRHAAGRAQCAAVRDLFDLG
jgi:hypothetical protein